MALAGVFQGCALVDSYARLGTANSEAVENALFSLLQQNPTSTEAVYGSFANLEIGFAALEKILDNPKDSQSAMLLRYGVGVLYIARKISANGAMLKHIGSGIENAARQAEHFSLSHANVIANIADLYQKTISTLKFRIQVNGVATHLQQPAIASRIRCLLFSSVRSAFLWQQLGGSRFNLMFRRAEMLKLTRELHQQARALNNL
jgi:high frequency lysogenization protein